MNSPSVFQLAAALFVRRPSLVLLAICAMSALGACGRSDVEQAVAAKFSATDTVKFQSVVQHGNHVCGEVSAAGSNATNGYKRFFYSEDSREADVEPPKTYSEEQVVQFERTCRMLSQDISGAGQTICSQAATARGELRTKSLFEKEWSQNCG